MRRLILGIASGLVSASAFAQLPDIPVSNWTVPPYSSSSGGITTMTDATPPRLFIGVQPCRIVDTRPGSGFPAAFGPPNLAAGVGRNFDLNDGPCPGLPFDLDAYSLNVTVVNPAGPGHLVIYPQGATQPSVSSINYAAGQTIANAVIVPAGSGGGVTVIAAAATNVLIDVNGYFGLGPSNSATSFLLVTNNVGGATAHLRNASSGCAISGCAVKGLSDTNTSGKAVLGQVTFGGNNSAGVFGSHGINTLSGTFNGAPSYTGAGVLGESPSNGVLGLSTFQAVAGSVISGSSELAYGILGFKPGATWGVFAGGNIGASGTKSFVEPHPTDPGLTITYVSLEGPEAGTYFRGRMRFQNGVARIPVPEHFRLVTDPEGLTVQITPIGAMATFAVMKMDLDEIVVQGSRNVEFSYLVQGVRASFRDLVPLRRGGEFAPRSADAKLPEWLSPVQKRLLIRNGTYREDGSVNSETAHRLGWDRVWAERERPAPQPATD